MKDFYNGDNKGTVRTLNANWHKHHKSLYWFWIFFKLRIQLFTTSHKPHKSYIWVFKGFKKIKWNQINKTKSQWVMSIGDKMKLTNCILWLLDFLEILLSKFSCKLSNNWRMISYHFSSCIPIPPSGKLCNIWLSAWYLCIMPCPLRTLNTKIK